jgi:NAD(P)H-hydrate repair Nnr-like enzyme with NAD(P)H-hydrate dehydratase domain
MARLVRSTPKAVNENRAEIATDFAKEYGVVTVLKGAGNIIASPEGRVMINRTGNSGMATGGSGDVLAGMTGSLSLRVQNHLMRLRRRSIFTVWQAILPLKISAKILCSRQTL